MLFIDIKQKEKTPAIFQGSDRGKETIWIRIEAQRRIWGSSVGGLPKS